MSQLVTSHIIDTNQSPAPHFRTDPSIASGCIGAARLVRQFAQLSMSGDTVDVEAFDPASLGSDVYLASLDLEVSWSSAPSDHDCIG